MEKKEGIKMEFETLNKSYKKEVMIGAVVIILIAIVLIVRFTFAKYQTTKNLTIAEGTISYKIPDFKIMAMYKNDGTEDVEITEMPESGYTINKDKSYCTTDNINKVYNKVYTNEEGKHVITGLSKDSKCYIYFDKKVVGASTTILGNITVKEEAPDFSKVVEWEEGVYKAKDDDGDTYYWRGRPTNNYVKFADKFWRIIRINGDGTIRIIYDGETARANGTKFTAPTSAFNSSYNNNMYLGFRYTNGEVHGLETESTILQSLNSWYKNNLANYSNKIDMNAGFCGDRTPSTSETEINNEGGIGTTTTYYGGYIRLKTNKSPVLTCPTEDFYTMTSSTKGNKSLTNPIGLITADEVAMSGGVYGKQNKYYYLYTGQSYWAMSPAYYLAGAVYPSQMFEVGSEGALHQTGLPSTMVGMRPVINLKANIELTGTGTMTDPYIVSS